MKWYTDAECTTWNIFTTVVRGAGTNFALTLGKTAQDVLMRHRRLPAYRAAKQREGAMIHDREYWLEDDGTMDTVIGCCCELCEGTWTVRVCSETAAGYREETGELTDESLLELVEDLLIDNDECPGCGEWKEESC
jgi:hypothetical protein